MNDPRNLAVSPRTSEDMDSDLAADLRRDLGADTLFFICAIEAALGVEHSIDRSVVQLESAEEIEQLHAPLLDEAA
mgnify:CR=1 FL=1